MDSINITRRRAVAASLSILALPALLPGVQAGIVTPRQTTGPFYPLELPLDHDNDLVQVAGQSGIAQGEITHVVGRVVDVAGQALANADVQIWQVNAHGRYHHPHDRRERPLDPNFQGFGSTMTDAEGNYRFRTIRPVPYPGRTPHIHFAVIGEGRQPFVTQMYIEGEPQNERDGLLNSIRDPEVRQSIVVPFEHSKAMNNEWLGEFNIVMPT